LPALGGPPGPRAAGRALPGGGGGDRQAPQDWAALTSRPPWPGRRSRAASAAVASRRAISVPSTRKTRGSPRRAPRRDDATARYEAHLHEASASSGGRFQRLERAGGAPGQIGQRRDVQEQAAGVLRAPVPSGPGMRLRLIVTIITRNGSGRTMVARPPEAEGAGRAGRTRRPAAAPPTLSPSSGPSPGVRASRGSRPRGRRRDRSGAIWSRTAAAPAKSPRFAFTTAELKSAMWHSFSASTVRRAISPRSGPSRRRRACRRGARGASRPPRRGGARRRAPGRRGGRP